MKNLNELYNESALFANTDLMPVLFLGHGSPMNAIEENQFVSGFKEIAQSLPTPAAILCISAHWFTNGTKVTSMIIPRTIHDFSGFPQALYEVQYPAKGSLALANETKKLLFPTHIDLDEKWGLDHGAWSVIKHLYPQANIPIIELSIDYTKSAQYHFDLAKKLQVLRNKGILIIGSGNIIHNLRLVDFQHIEKDNYGYAWAIEAKEKLYNYINNRDFQPLINYHTLSTAVQLSIPTPEHYLPLIYTLGLQQKEENILFFNDKLVGGSISMTSIKIG